MIPVALPLPHADQGVKAANQVAEVSDVLWLRTSEFGVHGRTKPANQTRIGFIRLCPPQLALGKAFDAGRVYQADAYARIMQVHKNSPYHFPLYLITVVAFR